MRAKYSDAASAPARFQRVIPACVSGAREESRIPLLERAKKIGTAACSRPEPFGFAQGKLREGSRCMSSFAYAQDGAKRAPLRAGSLSGTGFQPLGLTGWKPVPLENDRANLRHEPKRHHIRQFSIKATSLPDALVVP
jgi:hypothetical protein